MTDFRKNTQISNFMKIRPVEAKFHMDGQADMTKLIFAVTVLRTRLIKTATFATIWRCYKFKIKRHRENFNVIEYKIIQLRFVSWYNIYFNCNLYVVRLSNGKLYFFLLFFFVCGHEDSEVSKHCVKERTDKIFFFLLCTLSWYFFKKKARRFGSLLFFRLQEPK